LFGITTQLGVVPNPGDVYDPTDLKFHGNSAAGKHEAMTLLDWNTNAQINFDLRLFYFQKPPEAWSECRWSRDGPYPDFYWKQALQDTQICYSADALKNA
jgi:hypothetical protein